MQLHGGFPGHAYKTGPHVKSQHRFPRKETSPAGTQQGMPFFKNFLKNQAISTIFGFRLNQVRHSFFSQITRMGAAIKIEE